jgi:hypothetical protein
MHLAPSSRHLQSASIDTKQGSASQSIDASGNLQLAYGAPRATFVLGD